MDAVEYVKVCDRHGYCVMKIQSNEDLVSSKRSFREEVTIQPKRRLVRKYERARFFQKTYGKKESEEGEEKSLPTQNPLISQKKPSAPKKMQGLYYRTLTLNLSDEPSEEEPSDP